MTGQEQDIQTILARAATGDERAVTTLLEIYRPQLRRMVALRLDAQLAARIDASDVVQDALADAAKKLEAYLRSAPLPFYPWLYRLTTERLVQLRRFNYADKRMPGREVRLSLWSDESGDFLAGRLCDRGSSPSRRMMRDELYARVRLAVDSLDEKYREILVMHYIEDLSFADIGAIVGITENNAKVRHVRALDRMRMMMDGVSTDVE